MLFFLLVWPVVIRATLLLLWEWKDCMAPLYSWVALVHLSFPRLKLTPLTSISRSALRTSKGCTSPHQLKLSISLLALCQVELFFIWDSSPFWEWYQDLDPATFFINLVFKLSHHHQTISAHGSTSSEISVKTTLSLTPWPFYPTLQLVFPSRPARRKSLTFGTRSFMNLPAGKTHFTSLRQTSCLSQNLILSGHQQAAPHLKLKKLLCKQGCSVGDIGLAGFDDISQVTQLAAAKFLAAKTSQVHSSTWLLESALGCIQALAKLPLYGRSSSWKTPFSFHSSSTSALVLQKHS